MNGQVLSPQETKTENPFSDVGANKVEEYGDRDLSTHTEKIIGQIPETSWISIEEIMQGYREETERPLHKTTVTKCLRELESLGEIEGKQGSWPYKYRKADRPIREVLENHRSPLSEDLPEWLEKRIMEKVDEKIEEEMDELVEKLEEEISPNRIVRSSRDDSDSLNPQSRASSETCESYQLLKEIIQEEKEIRPRDLYEEFYSRKGERRPVERTLRNRLQELTSTEKVEKKGYGTGTEYVWKG